MNEVKTENKRAFYLKSLLFMLIPAIIARILSLLYSECATDITVLPIVTKALNYGAIAFTCVMVGAAYASITAAIYRYSGTAGIGILIMFSLVFFGDCLIRFFSDYIGGELRYREILAIITLLTEFFAQAAMAMCAWMISVAIHHLYKLKPAKLYSLTYASLAALAVQFAVPFFRWIFTVLDFLNDVEWIPTSAEIGSILEEGAVIIVCYAGVTWLISRIVLRFLMPRDKN